MLKLFSNRSIAAKLAVMAIVGAICMALVAATVLLIARSQLLTERTEKAHAVADVVWSLADAYHRQAAAGTITEDEAKKKFFEAAGNIWYENHTNYLFIYDYDTGIVVSNPGVKTLLGKDMRGVKDAFGLPFADMLMDLARGPQVAAKPQRAAASRLRPRVTRSPRRHVAKRRPPRSPRG